MLEIDSNNAHIYTRALYVIFWR